MPDSISDANDRAVATLSAAKCALESFAQMLPKQVANAGALIAERRGDIIVTGVGKSAIIGMKTAATLTSLGHRAVFLHPVEAVHGDAGIVSSGDTLIAYSYSGESLEVTRLINHLKAQYELLTIAVTGRLDSTLAMLADAVIAIPIDKEGSPHELAPMASTTAALVVGDMLASALTDPGEFTPRRFAAHHPGGALGLALVTVGERMAKGATVPAVTEDASIERVLSEITEGGFGSTAVVDEKGALCGVITDGDIRRLLLKHQSIDGVRARDAMNKDPKTVGQNDTLRVALSVMEERKITNLIVVDESRRPVGIVHIHDIIEA